MSFKIWYAWTNSLSWRYKWFIILILLRPFIDQYYELKRISPLLSPLYWAGILTLIFSINVLRIKTDKSTTHPYRVFLYWSFLYVLSLILNFTFKNLWSLATIAIFMKYITLIFIFFFLTRFIRTDREIVGIMTTFLYSCILTIMLIIISGSYKISGLYDSVQNIAFYISVGYVVNTYLFIKSSSWGGGQLWKYFLGLALVLASFVTLQHIATIAIILVVTLIFLYYSRKISLIALISSVVFILLFWNFFGSILVEDYVAPQLNTEIEALQGGKESARMFHGRMSRWEVFIPMFFKLNPVAIGFGSAYGLESDFDLLLESNIHNDYFRIMLASGIVGLLGYLYFLYLQFQRIKYLKVAEKFLIASSLAIILLYSITTYPTIYPSVMYVTLSAFAFALRPVYS
jgi:O-antigen ligase